MPTIILSTGRDPEISKHRDRALTGAGFKVVPASTSPEIINRLFNGGFDIVILCNSIPGDERRKLASIIRNYSPSTPVLVIADMQGRVHDYGTRTTAGYPDDVVAAVQELVTISRQPHPMTRTRTQKSA
jgi:DNA-binding response OmpR family regulator